MQLLAEMVRTDDIIRNGEKGRVGKKSHVHTPSIDREMCCSHTCVHIGAAEDDVRGEQMWRGRRLKQKETEVCAKWELGYRACGIWSCHSTNH